MKTSICKGCGRLIGWIRTSAGKYMPVDYEPVLYWQDPGGKQKIVIPGGKVVSARLFGTIEACAGKGYMSHFATCPQAKEFRGGGHV